MELSKVQSCLEVLDPVVTILANKVDSLEASRDKLDGRLAIIVWLVGANITLMIGLLVTLFGWGLTHITVRAQVSDQNIQQIHASDKPERVYAEDEKQLSGNEDRQP